MIRTYCIGGQPVTVSWVHRQHPPIYTIRVADLPAAGSVERTALGRYLAVDAHRRRLGTFSGLRQAVERVVREAPRGG